MNLLLVFQRAEGILSASLSLMAPPCKRAPRREEFVLELACEWGLCRETFSAMQEFCQHVEDHFRSIDMDIEESDVPGMSILLCLKKDNLLYNVNHRFESCSK